MNRTWFFDTALLPQGWRQHVRVMVQDGQISAVLPDTRPAEGDQHEALAVPGLPNVHSHAFQRAMAGLTEQLGPRGTDDFWSWRALMYRFLAHLDADDIEVIASYAYADMLEAGFTSVGEFHYLHRTPEGGLYSDPAELATRHLAAADASGIGLTLLPVLYRHGDFGGTPPKPEQRRFITSLDEFGAIHQRLRAAIAARPDRALGIAPHSLRAVAPAQLATLLAQHPSGPIHIHAAEQLKEVDDCLAWSGQRPIQWLLEHAPVDRRWCVVHATHLTAVESSALAHSQAIAGLCPVTEANLGDGLFPAAAYLAAGGRWAIGTDSHVSLDAAGELRQLEYAQRLHTRGRNTLASAALRSTGRRLYHDALAGGAQALGLPVGAIAPGHRADLLLLDASHPDLAGRHGDAWLDTWIFSGGRTLIRSVIANGAIVVEHRRHRDRERIDQRFREVSLKLLQLA